MEFNRFTLGAGILILLILGGLYYYSPTFTPTALVSGVLEPTNPFSGKMTSAIEKIFRNTPQAIIELKQPGGEHIGFILPGGNGVQFTSDTASTDKDVVIILNATNAKLTSYHTYPEFVQNEFTYIPPEQLVNENPYVRAQYPSGFYAMPVNVE